jgi:hypothetical protein
MVRGEAESLPPLNVRCSKACSSRMRAWPAYGSGEADGSDRLAWGFGPRTLGIGQVRIEPLVTWG